VARGLGQRDDVQQTLLLRNPRKLSGQEPNNAQVVIGDVLDRKLLREVMTGQDIVYANLAGEDLDKQAVAVIDAMQKVGVKRLVFVLSLGIYDEVPGRFGEWNRATIGEDLKPYRRAADAIEAAGLDFTVLRPAWLTDEDEVDYEITTKGEPFRGTVVSRRSVAELIVQIIVSPELHVGANLGLNKPNSDGDKPYFM
jgi:uncharacterized protein YbjT (DUF2867 family)